MQIENLKYELFELLAQSPLFLSAVIKMCNIVINNPPSYKNYFFQIYSENGEVSQDIQEKLWVLKKLKDITVHISQNSPNQENINNFQAICMQVIFHTDFLQKCFSHYETALQNLLSDSSEKTSEIFTGTYDETIWFLKKILKKESEIRQKKEPMVRSHLRLVAKIASKYKSENIEKEELIQEGALWLMRALETYDYRTGNLLSTYTRWWIKVYILQLFRWRESMIKVSPQAYRNLQRIKQVQRKYKTLYNRFPSLSEIKEETGVSIEKIQIALEIETFQWVNIDGPVRDDIPDGVQYRNIIPDQKIESFDIAMISEEQRQIILQALRKLNPHEERIIRLYYGIGNIEEHTLQKIGDDMWVSRERIRQIIERVKEKLRNKMQPLVRKNIF